ncbi:MAG: histidine phosphatase family protein [Acidimicrobiia bacterium]|nr:histidine phosphatase family protein [Acidimicrobiia bacterium]MDH4307373.1 histidine phosphatase family protein [Acidimicrobiia bacterium]MDH5292491.1 histidine phosphatase family protein [Acidimicrobiia bacterium]
MPRLLVIRHGAIATSGVEFPARDGLEPLSPLGVVEVEALASMLAGEPITAIHSSPAVRARQTAEAIARRHRLEPQVDAALAEVDMGEWSGQALVWAKQQPDWRTFQTRPGEFTFPGGESFVSLVERTGPCLERIGDSATGTVVVTAHLGNVMAFLALAGVLEGHVDIPTASVTDFDLGGPKIRVGEIGRRPD